MIKNIEILCAVTCVYEDKKLAIICPLGKIIEPIEKFDAKYLANRFSGDIDTTYPIEALVEVEQILSPIVNRFGKIPDKSYATIAGIRGVETGEDMKSLKKQIDEIYTIEKDLTDDGYESYSVYYVDSNIEDFTDELDIPFSEDRTLLTIDSGKYDIYGLIRYIRKKFLNVPEYNIPKLFNECLEHNEYYEIIGREKVLDDTDVKEFYKSVNEGSIYIPFAIKNSENIIALGNGEKFKCGTINIGEVQLSEEVKYGICIDLVNNKYIINQVESVYSESIGMNSICIVEDAQELTLKLIDTIQKFKV